MNASVAAPAASQSQSKRPSAGSRRAQQAVTFVGRVGDDPFGRWLRDDLAAEGVTPALAVDRTRGTGVIQVLVEPDGERTMVPDRGANAFWTETDVPEELIAKARHLHVVGYMLLDQIRTCSFRKRLPDLCQSCRHVRP